MGKTGGDVVLIEFVHVAVRGGTCMYVLSR